MDRARIIRFVSKFERLEINKISMYTYRNCKSNEERCVFAIGIIT